MRISPAVATPIPVWVVIPLVFFGLLLDRGGRSAAVADGLPLDEDGHLVQFERDITPVFRDHCLKCHGPNEEKAGFRIDDRELVRDYLVPEEPESSTLYVDYLASTDEDYLMPPKAHENPLSAGELALVRVWIQEGAEWPEEVVIEAIEPAETGDAKPSPPQEEALPPLPARFWAFQGFFHPATIHFPIALLSVGGLFVVIGLKWPSMGTQVPLACLLLGSVSSVTASLMGWSFASQLGYMSLYDSNTEIFWHRWSGVLVSSLALVLALVAVINLRRKSDTLRHVWKVGLVVVAIMIAMVGHQGGELHYGQDFYAKAFEKLLGKPAQTQADAADDPEEELVATE